MPPVSTELPEQPLRSGFVFANRLPMVSPPEQCDLTIEEPGVV
jgi:hypothetical protein